MWKTLSPFWGEEYEVHLQPTFHSISIYVMDEDALRYGQVSCGEVGARGGELEAGGFGCLPAQPHCRHHRIHTWPCWLGVLGHKRVKLFLEVILHLAAKGG